MPSFALLNQNTTLVLKLFKNMQIHIIQIHTDTYYSSLSYILK